MVIFLSGILPKLASPLERVFDNKENKNAWELTNKLKVITRQLKNIHYVGHPDFVNKDKVNMLLLNEEGLTTTGSDVLATDIKTAIMEVSLFELIKFSLIRVSRAHSIYPNL